MNTHGKLKPCPFCGGEAKISVSDDEGNRRNEDYENDPWSGLSFRIIHAEQDDRECPVAGFKEDGGYVGMYLYESRLKAIKHWNKRI